MKLTVKQRWTYLAGQYEGLVNEPLENLDPNSDGTRIARREDGYLLPDYRLPTEAEWEYAALGLIENTMYERISQRKTYPWNGNYNISQFVRWYSGFPLLKTQCRTYLSGCPEVSRHRCFHKRRFGMILLSLRI